MNKSEKVNLPGNDLLRSLNKEQKEAVLNTEGPLLVLSGAGTGKTKVLTTRLASLIFMRKAKTSEVFAVTFTNKAAFEMKVRVEKLIGHPVEGMFIGTFHSIGARILRKHAEFLSLKSDFTILDTDDQTRLIKQVISMLDLDLKKFVPKNYCYFIDNLKNNGLSFNQISNHEFEHFSNGKLSKIYELYQKRLQVFNSVDFGDLILQPVNLLKKHTELLENYQERFKYILVDEYQDTNTSQYFLLRLLAEKNKNICCVGDEDQSIYGWRGAQLKNILNFESDFKNSKIIRLEQNYRSKGHILTAASNIISENKERIGKKLWTSDGDGQKVKIINVEDDSLEAIHICEIIKELNQNDVNLNKVAVLTRASFQFKEIEDRFIKDSIKYKVVGGLKFYERKEIKDAISFFRVLINNEDNLALERIINVPKRGIGLGSLSKLNEYSNINKISLYKSLQEFLKADKFSKKVSSHLKHFFQVYDKHLDKLKLLKHSEVAGSLLDDTGYTEMLQNDKTPEAEGRLENLKKLILDIDKRDSLYEFLEEVSLVIDNSVESSSTEKVSLMTLHSAKGLEFNHVFLPGWEEGIFPNQRSIDEQGNKGLEEERRLAYVGITRARESLSIIYANSRKQYNQTMYRTIPSRFLTELPKKSCEILIQERDYSNKGYAVNNYRKTFYRNKKFTIGDNVLHTEFGKGIVLGISGERLQIRFSEKKEIMKIFSDFVDKA
ncbi:UvrD-helicase domain-containing protein [Rickettsiales bacterium]|nr:UvrD-helicase domain-containing protein [Rickettsiales bacterium]